MSHFFAYLYRLRFIRRWSLMRSTVTENVAEHSYYVAVLTHALCVISRDVFHRQVHVERAVLLALFHDVTEVITGDIPTPVKHHNAAMIRAIRDLEVLAGDQLLGMVPAELAGAYGPLLQPTEADAELLRWVKAADKLAAFLKCAVEVAAGNREFAVAKSQLEGIVHGLDLPEVEYFLRTFGPSFDRTLDEISD